MGCDCSKVERTPLWSAIPEYRQPTEIQVGENIECYAKRSGSPSGLKNDVGEQLVDRIKNTSMTSDLNGNINITFALTPNSTRTPTGWQFSIDSTTALSVLPELTWDSSGTVSGTIDDANANKAYQVRVIAIDGTGTIDERTFTFFPKKNAAKGETIQFVMPLVGSSPARITCAYGPRTPPANGASSMHNGIDIALTSEPKQGTIVAAADGVVVKAGPATGFGNWVVIEHYDSMQRLVCTTVYGHMKTIYVNVGDKVAAGQKIALEGNEGIGSGMHLHFELHKGKWRTPTDPVPYLNGTIDIAVNNDPNVESEDGTPQPTSFETVSTSNSGMTTAEGNAGNECPGDPGNEASPGVAKAALDEDGNIDDRENETDPELPPPVNNTNKYRSACAQPAPPPSEVKDLIDEVLDDYPELDANDRAFIHNVAQIESNLDPYAKNPTSTATGLYQFLDALAVKYYGLIGVSPTCANRCDAKHATRAMVRFYKDEIKPYWENYVSSGKTTIAGKQIKATDWSAQYNKLSQGDFMYGLVHHDGVGNAVNGKDLGGVNYWRKKIGVNV